jgi:hypothetical protein
MRFFTHDWSTLDDVEADNISSEHLRVVKLASDRCGIPLAGFVREFDLRGALVDRLLLQSGEAELNFDLIAGDNQHGYFALSLAYASSSFRYFGEDLGTALDLRSTRIRFDEFDVGSNGELHHRFLLWPKSRGEIDIQFAGLEWAKVPLPHRAYQNFGHVLQLSEPLSTATE